MLDTGVKLVRNVSRYNIGPSSLQELAPLLGVLRTTLRTGKQHSGVVFLVDRYFQEDQSIKKKVSFTEGDTLRFIDSRDEPTTDSIDQLVADLRNSGYGSPAGVVGMGGGTSADERGKSKP